MLVEILFFYFLLNYAHSSLTTEYYENLISQRTAAAMTYKPPQSNEEFRAGVESTTITDFGSYDFIIVGAGSAGAVLATRLSEKIHFSVLLLEAGGEEDDFSVIPSMFPYLQFSPMNWGYYTTPQTTCCLGMIDKKCGVARGKVLGGSSSINAMMYVRGNRLDFDHWEALGNPGWSYKHVLPYFLKSENSQLDQDPKYQSTGGFWNVEYAIPPSPLLENYFNASIDKGMVIEDYNGAHQFGAAQMQFNIKNGRRQSTGTAFLLNAKKRRNLKVLTKVLATKILIDKKTKTAKGIEFVTKDQKFQAAAKREVIVSCGTFNSPQLLMLSGIGPKDHLEELGIDLIADLPVGRNYIDHPLFTGLFFRTDYATPNASLEDTINEYLHGLGPLTKPASTEGIGFFKVGEGPPHVPSVELMFDSPPNMDTNAIMGRQYNYNSTVMNGFLNNMDPYTDFTLMIVLLHEKSRGRITLNSTDPTNFPNIDLNIFSREEDVKTMIAAINYTLELIQTEPFQKINTRLIDIELCPEFVKYSDDFWECLIRQLSLTLYHPCGTTRMGPNPRTSVVDSNLKVHGIQGLRVVDAGVFPSSMSGHLNAPTVMVAEKISDEIKREYGRL